MHDVFAEFLKLKKNALSKYSFCFVCYSPKRSDFDRF